MAAAAGTVTFPSYDVMIPQRTMHDATLDPPRPAPAVTRRRWLLASGAAAWLAGCAPVPSSQTPAPAPAPFAAARLRLIGEARLPSGMPFQGTTVGGLSGLDHDPASGLYYLVSDDGDQPRFYTARLPLDAGGWGHPELVGVTALRRADGSAWPSSPAGKLLDPESIRWNAARRSLLWTSEGNAAAGWPPALYESRPDGSLLRQFSLPPMFDFSPAQGPRGNLTLEGLALAPDGKTAWLSMEAALRQDGPLPTPAAVGGPCRLTQLDLDSGQPLRQIAYIPDAIPRPPVPAMAHADNGISEILMLDASRLLVLERAYMAGYGADRGNSLRLYLVDTRQGGDTRNLAVLQAGNYTPVQKSLVADFSAFVGPGPGKRLDRLDNTEGMTWGPRLANGNRSLVFISDDNFSRRQITQLLAFEFLETAP